MKYALIKEFVGQYAVCLMCRALQVSRSGFYRWLQRAPCRRAQHRERLIAHVLDTFAAFNARYGSPRLTAELNANKVPCCVNTVAKIMQRLAIKARNGKAFTYRQHALASFNVAENHLFRRFHTKTLNRRWTSDITYIWFAKQWFYLAAIMDLCSRRIVGWAFDDSMTTELITSAYDMAIKRREVAPGLILHSDRGVQYRAQAYQDHITASGCVPSMSRKGNCWDNAPMESFFSRLKVELIFGSAFRSKEDLRSSIFEYIEVFYNRHRRHSALGQISPETFERKLSMA